MLAAAVAAGSAIAPQTAAAATVEWQNWATTIAYVGGDTAIRNGVGYRANWWTQGQDPATNNGGAGTGQPWTPSGPGHRAPPAFTCATARATPPAVRSPVIEPCRKAFGLEPVACIGPKADVPPTKFGEGWARFSVAAPRSISYRQASARQVGAASSMSLSSSRGRSSTPDEGDA